jgi:hypothetical protein
MEEPVSEIGTELLFENEVVRVWSMELAPGQTSPYHRHELDYLFVYVTPSRISRMDHPNAPETTREFADGYVNYINVGDGTEHQIRNDNSIVHRQVLVEFKNQGLLRPPTQDNGRAEDLS